MYEYGRIRVLAEKLAEAGVCGETVTRIMAGGELIRRGDKPEKKAAWLSQAMQRMDEHLDEELRHRVRESCACSLGGKRSEIARGIARKHSTIEERIQAANEARLVFGHRVTPQADGTIEVCFYPEGRESYPCVCLPKAREPVSITYCYCCGGHVRHHLETALGCRLECTVSRSALASGGKEPCTFVFRRVK